MTNAVNLASLAVSGALSADTNGNVGVGTSSPATTFHAVNTGGGGVSGANPSGEVARIQQTPSVGSGGYVAQRLFLNKTSTANDGVTQSFEGLAVGGDRYALANIGGYIDNAGSGNAVSGYFAILTKPTNASITERARISSSGAFGVSNTSPSYLVESGANGGNDALIRGQGAFLTRKYSVAENRAGTRTMRLTLSVNSLQFVNIFLDASAHRYDNGGSWQAFRLALQFMAEGSILRMNQRMPNYEYGGSTFGVFTFGNPPSWTFVSGATWYFDFTVAANHAGYYALTVQGPGAVDATLTTIA